MSKENRDRVITHVVAITGSMRFYKKMQAIAKMYTKAGRLVLMPVKIGSDEKKQPLDEDTKKMLLQMQHERILMADELCVINVDGYIGDGTQEAIDFAKSHHVPITYLSPVPFGLQAQTITLCGSRRFLDTFKKIYKAYTLNRGWIVHMPAIFSVDNPGDLSKEQLQYLDLLHQEKMKQSDWVYIINRGGYIGEDTRKEIEFCLENNIPLKYYEYPDDREDMTQGDVDPKGEKMCDRPIDWAAIRDMPIISTEEGIIPKIDWEDLLKVDNEFEREDPKNFTEPETTDDPETDQKGLRAEFAKADDDALKEFNKNFDKLTNGNADQGDVGTECDPAKFIDPDGARNATVVKTLSREGRYDIKPGDKVMITEGAFQGLTGTYLGTYPYVPDGKSLKDCDGICTGIITVSMAGTDMPKDFQVVLDADQFIKVRDPKEVALQAIAYTNMKKAIADRVYDPGKKIAEQFADQFKVYQTLSSSQPQVSPAPGSIRPQTQESKRYKSQESAENKD